MKKHLLKRAIWLLLFSVIFQLSYSQTKFPSTGVPAAPYPFEYHQPSGDLITIYIKGDGAVHWYQTIDKYTIMQDANGIYHYCTKDDYNNLIMTDVKVSNIDSRTENEITLLNSIDKEIRYSADQILKMKTGYLPQIEDASKGGSFPSKGTRGLLLILQDFPDAAATLQEQYFDDMMNLTGYNGTGSFKDYYYANSYGQLTLVTTVLGWNTAINNHDYYCDGCVGADPNARYREFVREAVDFAEGAGVDFTNYDNDGDGECDGVMVIHQGEGAECGSNKDIWSHSWSLSAPFPTDLSVTYDGIYINDYTLNPEFACGGSPGTIGVLCHEFGHNLSLPDFYDTDYSTNGQGFDLGDWDPMASGSYNNGGASPPLHNAWSRDDLDWFTIPELTVPCSYTLDVSYDNKEAYYFTTPTTGEYFILENRQQSGFDEYIPGHGMLIFHVDKNYAPEGSNVWAVNMVNAYSTHQAMDIEEADGTTTTVSGDPFPGTANKTSFTDATTPSAQSWALENSNKPITNIAENSGIITFDFMGGDSNTPQNFTATTISSDQIDLSWVLNGSSDPVLIAVSSDGLFGEPNPGTVYSVNDPITGGGTVIYNAGGTTFSHTGLAPGTIYYYKAWSVGTGEVYSCGKTTDATTCSVPEIFIDFEDLSDNWTTESATAYIWKQMQGATPTALTGPSIDNTLGTGLGSFMYTEADGGATGDEAYLLSPLLDLSNIASPTLKFYYHMYGASMGTLSVEMYNGGAWTQIWTMSGQQQTSETDAWTEQILDLSAYKNQYEQIRFKGVRGSSTTSDMAVDDISIYNDFSCTPPTTQANTFSTGTITQTSMQVNWLRGNGDNVLVVAHEGSAVDADPLLGTPYTANTTFGSGTQIGAGNYVVFAGNGTTVTVTGLIPSTTYHFAIYEYFTADNCYNLTELIGNDNTYGLPTVTTTSVSAITANTAQSGGEVIFENGAAVTERGVVWNTITNPTTSTNIGMTSDGAGAGVFVSNLTALAPNTTYYVRAYATNTYGTDYGAEEVFTTNCSVYSLPYSQNFDSGDACWDGTTGTDNWYNITPTTPVGDHTGAGGTCFMTNGNTDYGVQVVYDLESPTISLSGYTGCQLTFWIYMNAELATDPDYWDGGYLECWNGSTWTKMTTSRAYDGTLYVGSDNPLAGELAWSPASILDWTQITVDISAYDDNPDFKMRIRFGSDAAAVGPGWAIDDIDITGTISCTQPSTQTSAINDTPATNSIDLSWTRGDGDNVLVVAKEGSAVDSDPIMGTSYTANAAFGTGDQIGTGNFVVYNGSATSVNVTGLSEATTYHFAFYEYNNTSVCYLYPGAVTNSTTLTTPPSITSVTPDNFFSDKGKQLTIEGSGFLATTVTLGGVTGSIVSSDGSTLIVNFPAGNYTNNTLTVTNTGGSDNTTCTVNTRNTIPVGGGTDFHTTIQSALDGLFAWYGTTSFDAGQLPGAKIIEVYNGTYTETPTPNVTLLPSATNGLTIQNASGEAPVINATGLNNAFYIGALDNVTISGFAAYGSTNNIIYTEGDNNTITYNKCYGSTTASGIKLSAANNSFVKNNLIYGNYINGIHILNSDNVETDNNTAYDNGSSHTQQFDAQIYYDDIEPDATDWQGDATWYLFSDATINVSPTHTFGANDISDVNITKKMPVDITGYENLNISAYVRTLNSMESTDDFTAEYSFDNVAWTNFITLDGSTADNSAFVKYSATSVDPLGATTLYIRFHCIITKNNPVDDPSTEYWLVDDIEIRGDETTPSFDQGAGLYVESGTGTSVENNIFFTKSGTGYLALQTEAGITINSDYNTYFLNGNTNLVDYNGTTSANLAGWGDAGANDLETNPDLVNAGTDFHIKSTNGSYAGGEWPPLTATSGTWTNDASDSPSIDTGNPGDAFGNEPISGTAINQGVYGNTVQASKSSGAIINWTGAINTDWQNTGNWDVAAIPTASDNITIPAAMPNYPVIDDGATTAVCNSITIEAGASVTIAVNGQMTASGSITNNAGNSGIVINSDATGTGSLIQNTSGGVDATVNCYLASTPRQWHFISSPVAAEAFTSLPTVSNLFKYDELNADYWTGTSEDAGSITGWTAPSGNMVVAQAYAYNLSATNTLSYTGQLNDNTSTSAITIAYTDNGVTAPNTASYDDFDGWNLIGNPYTSAIDWDNAGVGHAAANLLDAIYYYDDATSHSYASYVGGIGTNGGTQYIPAMQGFFVKGDATELGGTLNITSAARVHNSQAYWKTTNITPDNFIRLQISANSYTDETVVRLSPDATDLMDNGMDAYKMFTWNTEVPQLYTNTTSNTDYSINTIPVINEGNISLPLKALQTGDTYTITATEFNFSDTKVFLKDNLSGELTELNLNSSINLTSSESDGTSRFELIFSKQTTNINENLNRYVNVYPNPNNGSFQIKIGGYDKEYNVEISNVIGKIIYKNTFIDKYTKELKLTIPTSGIYFVKVKFDNNATIVKKIFVK